MPRVSVQFGIPNDSRKPLLPFTPSLLLFKFVFLFVRVVRGEEEALLHRVSAEFSAARCTRSRGGRRDGICGPWGPALRGR